jgi:hypothetical protein
MQLRITCAGACRRFRNLSSPCQKGYPVEEGLRLAAQSNVLKNPMEITG